VPQATFPPDECLITVKILDERSTDPPGAETAVAGLFTARYPELVRLAGLLGADDPEDIAQEAFARLLRSHGSLRDSGAALAYLRATVCNLTRNRRRHLRVARLRTPSERYETESPEHTALLREEHREVITALAALPVRRREAIVLRYWLGLSEAEIAAAMGISAGTVKSQISRGLAVLGRSLEEGQ
jgi:RNA polymerase sigma factor (sigma-70 family)